MSNQILNKTIEDLKNLPLICFYSLVAYVSNYCILDKVTIYSFLFTCTFILICNIFLSVYVFDKLTKKVN